MLPILLGAIVIIGPDGTKTIRQVDLDKECRAEAPIAAADAGANRSGKLGEQPPAHLMRSVRRSYALCDFLEVRTGEGWKLVRSPPGQVRQAPTGR